MLSFLTDEWIAALDEAATTDAALRELSADLVLTIEQEVTGGPDGDVRYHVVFHHGQVSVRPGPAPDATLRFSQDYETAAAISLGSGSAQRAFTTGQLRVGGDLRVLLDHGEAMAQLHDAFGAIRARTVAVGLGED